jgi:hypothetical protein
MEENEMFETSEEIIAALKSGMPMDEMARHVFGDTTKKTWRAEALGGVSSLEFNTYVESVEMPDHILEELLKLNCTILSFATSDFTHALIFSLALKRTHQMILESGPPEERDE